MENYFNKNVDIVLEDVKSSIHGLSSEEAWKRQVALGKNELPEKSVDSILITFLKQFLSPLIYVLIGASALLFYLQDHKSFWVIVITLLLNAVVGTWQEGKAKNALAALKNMTRNSTLVLRDGQFRRVDQSEIVVGDIVKIEQGEKVPADMRVCETLGVLMNESQLTGESTLVAKSSEISKSLLEVDVPISEQNTMLFSGSFVMEGGALCVVTAVGLQTAFGKIYQQVSQSHSVPPLMREIDRLSRAIIIVVAAACAGIFTLGVVTGEQISTMFFLAVGVAVSLIPEGLPVAIAMILAIGVQRMSMKRAIVRKMPAVEALGQVDYLCVDKTGTITTSDLAFDSFYVAKSHEHLQTPDKKSYAEFELGVLLALTTQDSLSDPTEVAIKSLAEKLLDGHLEVLSQFEKIAEVPFNFLKKIRITSHRVSQTQASSFFSSKGPGQFEWHQQKPYAHVMTGAPEKVVAECTVDPRELQFVLSKIEEYAKHGLRVIGVAVCESDGTVVQGKDAFRFVGLVTFSSQFNPGVIEAIAQVKDAGIQVVMLTGDHIATAKAIAKKAGIFENIHTALTAKEFRALPDYELLKLLPNLRIVARAEPSDKLRLIELIQSQKQKVAMTGDGVNDAPALSASDIGLAMGKTGTEVAKDAADIVILDDNFTTIAEAVKEGRSIMRSIKQVLIYLFSTNLGELLVIVCAFVFRQPFPFSGAQIIWLNLVTDGFLTVAIGLEARHILRYGGKHVQEGLINKTSLRRIVFLGFAIAIVTYALYVVMLPYGKGLATSVSLTCLAVTQWFNAFNVMSRTQSVFHMKFWKFSYLWSAVAIVFVLQIAALHLPILQSLLTLEPLDVTDWLNAILCGFVVILAEELRKLHARRHKV